MAGDRAREIVGIAGPLTATARARRGKVAWLVSDTSQLLLQRPPDAEGVNGTDWRSRAACRDVDPDLFFPIGTSGQALLQIDEAKQICRTCMVRRPCLRWALERGEDAGVWGGTTEEERRILRQMRAPLRAGHSATAHRWAPGCR
jgi:WhiB family redox-sensing transcriptional regulator